MIDADMMSFSLFLNSSPTPTHQNHRLLLHVRYDMEQVFFTVSLRLATFFDLLYFERFLIHRIAHIQLLKNLLFFLLLLFESFLILFLFEEISLQGFFFKFKKCFVIIFFLLVILQIVVQAFMVLLIGVFLRLFPVQDFLLNHHFVSKLILFGQFKHFGPYFCMLFVDVELRGHGMDLIYDFRYLFIVLVLLLLEDLFLDLAIGREDVFFVFGELSHFSILYDGILVQLIELKSIEQFNYYFLMDKDPQIIKPTKEELDPKAVQQAKRKDIECKLKLLAQLKKQKEVGKDRKKIKYYEDLLNKHNYWDHQPTLRDDKVQNIVGNIEGKRQVKDVRKEPLDLPSEKLFWCEIDVTNDAQLTEFYFLLTQNYVEDDDNTFRFDYSKEFLQWSLTPPGFQPKWLVGIRNEKKELVGSITGVPVLTLVEEDKLKMAEINYLCVHKDYRTQGLTPLLISQVTRRVNLRDKWQAIYTSGKNLPTPFTRATYYHRSLNPKKLIDIRFSGLSQNQTLPMVKKLYSVPEDVTLEGLRPMTKKDIDGVTKLLNEQLSKFVVKFHYTQEEVKHYFLPRDKIIYTFVIDKIENVEGKKKVIITDMLSFYSLPSHVMKNPKHNMLFACYSYYNFATTVSYVDLIKNALILAKKYGYDVYNCLNLMDNATVFQDLHFQMGDGNLNYYLFNWIMKVKKIEPNQLGVVLF